jgi:hypothetical protein
MSRTGSKPNTSTQGDSFQSVEGNQGSMRSLSTTHQAAVRSKNPEKPYPVPDLEQEVSDEERRSIAEFKREARMKKEEVLTKEDCPMFVSHPDPANQQAIEEHNQLALDDMEQTYAGLKTLFRIPGSNTQFRVMGVKFACEELLSGGRAKAVAYGSLDIKAPKAPENRIKNFFPVGKK